MLQGAWRLAPASEVAGGAGSIRLCTQSKGQRPCMGGCSCLCHTSCMAVGFGVVAFNIRVILATHMLLFLDNPENVPEMQAMASGMRKGGGYGGAGPFCVCKRLHASTAIPTSRHHFVNGCYTGSVCEPQNAAFICAHTFCPLCLAQASKPHSKAINSKPHSKAINMKV